MSAVNLLQNRPHQLRPAGQRCLQLYGALPWWFCYSDNSLKGEPSLYKFTCLSPLLLLCVCIHTYTCVYVCIYMYIHTHMYMYVYTCICPLQGPLRAAAEVYHCFSWSFLQASKSRLCLLLVLMKNHRLHWLRTLFISH